MCPGADLWGGRSRDAPTSHNRLYVKASDDSLHVGGIVRLAVVSRIPRAPFSVVARHGGPPAVDHCDRITERSPSLSDPAWPTWRLAFRIPWDTIAA